MLVLFSFPKLLLDAKDEAEEPQCDKEQRVKGGRSFESQLPSLAHSQLVKLWGKLFFVSGDVLT